jgi:23S rRNA (uracil1939-C5)-methyltransferase
MNKNDIIDLEITSLSVDGSGVGRHSSGIAVFVPFSTVGDELSVRIVKTAKKYAFGIIETIKTPGAFRVKSDCPAFGKCGGCNFRHITYAEELRQKAGFVRDAFVRIGKFSVETVDIIGSDETNRYRNKSQVPFERGVYGYYAPRSHRIVPCADCKLQSSEINIITAEAANLCSAFSENVRNIYIRRGHYSGEIMLCIVVKKPIRKYNEDALIQYVKSKPQIKSLILNFNPENTNVILGKKNKTLYGEDFITDKICGSTIKLYPNAFCQVNIPQAEKLYSLAAEFADVKDDETALDLYCGIGSLTQLIARKAKKLYGAEIVPEAVKCAKENADVDGITNIDFFCGDAGETAEKLSGEKIDIVLTDPPRKGCDENTISNIIKINPKRIVMISCDPATAARDCRKLCENGYTLEKLTAVDMFPRTANVECAALLVRC